MKDISLITQEDHNFALMVNKEYDLPIDELCSLIRNARNDIEYWSLKKFDSNLVSPYKEFAENLFSSDAIIKKICITTNKGIIEINDSDSFFTFFSQPIHKMKSKFEKDKDYLIKYMTKLGPFDIILSYFNNTSLGEFQKRVAIGMFIIYFKIGKPILTETEWNLKPREALSYKHYLSRIVKDRLKKYA